MSRERFVQSNFRFVLKPTEVLNYGAHFADPDMYVETRRQNEHQQKLT